MDNSVWRSVLLDWVNITTPSHIAWRFSAILVERAHFQNCICSIHAVGELNRIFGEKL